MQPYEKTLVQTWVLLKPFKPSSTVRYSLWKAEETIWQLTIQESWQTILYMSLMCRHVGRVLPRDQILTNLEQGGDKIPRKGGPGISQSDLLVINKVSTSTNGRRTMFKHIPILQSLRSILPLM